MPAVAIVTENYAICDGCGARVAVTTKRYPVSWVTTILDRKRTGYCTRECLRNVLRNGPPDPQARLRMLGLSARDIELITMAGKGMRDKEVANKRGVRTQTVKNRLSEIREKFDVHSRAELVTRAIALGLIEVAVDPEQA